MKKISVLIPCYNEEENIIPLSNEIIKTFESDLPLYDYEIIFIDNYSEDNTRILLKKLCKNNIKIKAIFNTKNFGQNNSPYYGICQTTGDCTISMCADFQDPVELIPILIKEWENDFKIVTCIKNKSKENKFIRFLRSCYYKILKRMSNVEQIEHFTGFGLYDKSIINILKDIQDPIPYFRGVIAELGFKCKKIYYEQQKRRAGKSHNNWYTLYDIAMLSFTSYTKIGLRIATIFGFFIGILTLIIALIYLILKIIYWDSFPVGMAPLIIGVFFFNSIQLFFIGFIGEYVITINTRLRLQGRPLVIEEERINFNDEN